MILRSMQPPHPTASPSELPFQAVRLGYHTAVISSHGYGLSEWFPLGVQDGCACPGIHIMSDECGSDLTNGTGSVFYATHSGLSGRHQAELPYERFCKNSGVRTRAQRQSL